MAKTTVPIELSSTPSIVDNGNATAITIDSSERIIVNTANPAAGSAFDAPFQINGATVGSTAGNTGKIANLGFNSTTTNHVGLGVTAYRASAGSDWTTTGIKFTYDIDNSTAVYDNMLCFQGGNVGIGTSTPNTKIDVIGSTTNGSGVVDTIRMRNTGTTLNDGPRLQFTSGTSTSGAAIASQGKALNSADLVFYAGGNTERMRINSSGYITTPNQVMFHAGGLSSTSYTVSYSIAFNTERFDRGGNFNTSNGIFTAPVTGIYHFDTTVLITGASSSYTYDLQLYTSNQAYYAQSRNQYSSGSTGWNDNYLAHTGSWTVDMDAGDTAYIRYGTFGGGGLWTDAAWTHFSGYLVG